MYWFYLLQCTTNIYLFMLAASCKKKIVAIVVFVFVFLWGGGGYGNVHS